MQRPQPPAPQGAQKRPLDGQNTAEVKRPRVEAVAPPDQESLPEEGKSLDAESIKRRFEALQQEVRFGRQTMDCFCVALSACSQCWYM